MIGNDRLIIVLGMLHSGTTILTHLLRQHPSIVLGQDEPEDERAERNWSLENRWTALGEQAPIQCLLTEHPGKRVLLKQVWYPWWCPQFLLNNAPEARYLYICKEPGQASASWRKPTSLAGDALRLGDESSRSAYYDEYQQKADQFGESVAHFRRIRYADLLVSPQGTLQDAIVWAGLEPFEFDVSQVSVDIDIKVVLGRAV